jgi:hypothetical protein
MVTDATNFKIALERGDRDAFSFFAFGLANLWDRMGISTASLEALHTSWWYLHLLDFLIFLAYLPISKHSHILTSPMNVFFRNLGPTGVLKAIPNIEEREVFGVGKVTGFSWKQMLDFYTCTECGCCGWRARPRILEGPLAEEDHARHALSSRRRRSARWASLPSRRT